jgi:PAS domain S-box-containing protein
MAQEQIVLVADKHLSDRLGGILRAHGYHLQTSSVGEDALAAIESDPPALVLAGVRLADMSGFELCRRMKHRLGIRHIPIIFITEQTSEEDEAYQAGASDFLAASSSPVEVFARVQTQLYRHGPAAASPAGADASSASVSTGSAIGEEWMRLAMQVGCMFAFEWDIQSDAMRRSHAAVEILGVASEGTGQGFLQMVHPQDRERLRQIRSILGPAYNMYDTQYRVCRPDGTIATLRESGRALFDAAGRPTRVIGMAADVTEQVSTQNDLEQGRAHLLQLIERLPIGVALSNRRGRIEYINERFVEMFGYQLEEIASLNTWWQRAYPDEQYRREVIENWTRTVETAIRRGESIPTREYRITGKDGTEHTVNVSGAVLGERKLLLFDDITARKRSEAVLRENEERFRSMADNAPVMLWISGADKLCTFFNKGWLRFTGRTIEQELGNGWAAGVHADDLEQCLSVYSTAFDARQPFQMEYRLRRADGQYRWVLHNGAPRHDTEGRFAGYIGSCVDTTDLKRNLEQMLAAQKLESLGVLAGGVAHDFHNFLGCILADAVVTMSELEIGSPARDGLERIEAVAVQAAQLVRQIMDYTAQDQQDPGPVDLSRLVREMVQILRVCVPKGARIGVDLPPSLPLPHASAAQLRQMVLNLILNAGEAIGPQGGVIAISGWKDEPRRTAGRLSSASERFICLEISDSGAGMSEEVSRRIFDPSFSTKGAGRGLGLAAVQGIVRGHGGFIGVTSAPGKGSRFQILLPCERRMPVEAPHREHVPERLPNRRGAILIVEDEETLRISVATMLRKQGFAVLEAGDGYRAVDLIRDQEEDIAVVLLDLTLPGTSSPEVFAELQRARPDAKVILTSAYGRESVAGPLRALERESFIRKPYHFSELVTVVKAALPREDVPVSGRR